MVSFKNDTKKFNDPSIPDESFDDEDVEEGLIKDSVLQLTSDRYDDFNPDEFIGAKLRTINNASQDELGSEYRGVTVARKNLPEDSLSNSQHSSDDSDDASVDENDDESANENESYEDFHSDPIESRTSDQDDESILSESVDEDANSTDEKPIKRSKDKGEAGLSIYSKKSLDVHEDIEKGNAIRQQYEIWENLLECRIKLQKCLSASNRLPQNEKFSFLVSKLERHDQNKISKTVKKLYGTLRTLIDAQVALMNSQPEFSTSKSSNHLDDQTNIDSNENEDDNDSISSSIASGFSDNEEDIEESSNSRNENGEPAKKLRKLEDFSRELNKLHCGYLPARNEAIQKWNDKTRVSSGKISNANFSAFDQSTLKQIEHILCDKERLIKKTQIKRSLYSVIDPEDDSEDQQKTSGKEIDQVSADCDVEIFDDDDFYHKLLRDLIDQRSSDITDPHKMGRQWMELQKARSKMKRNIDVKSTKGRRLRYTVHQKLVNFMAPIPYNSYTEEAETELFASLFGKLKQ